MEQIVIELENIHMQFLDKEILNIDRLAVHQFDRIGIVGKNGSGKSTVLKIMQGALQPTKGIVRRHGEIGCFRQMDPPISNEVDPIYAQKLRVSKNQTHFSGGEETRVKLAQLFSQYNELLMIDEPTTHLDREGIDFLLDELRYYYGALILVSHNRLVLNELVTTIWEIDDGKIKVYQGNYDKYMDQKQLEKIQHQQSYEKYIKEKSRLERAAQEKFKKAQKITQASKMSKKDTKAQPNRMFETKSKGTSQKSIERAAKAIESRLHQLDEVEAMTEQRSIIFHPSKAVELHNKFPIMADRFNLFVGEKQLLHDVNFQIPLGKKLALTGNNGVGKTTLLEAIVNKNEQLIMSPKIKLGYFKQMGYQFKTDETIWDFIVKRSTHEAPFLRTALHTMHFSGTDLRKSIQSLSGGEAVRLQLCELFLGEYNVLLLDEATNFLDIQTVEALETFVHGYKGTIIFIAHDEQFIKNCADQVWKIEDKKIISC